MHDFIEVQVEKIREKVKDDKVLLALSGGVDSSVVAALLHKAIGSQLYCMFIDHGLLRKGEAESVVEMFGKNMKINLTKVDAKDRFLGKLAGVSDPEKKRKIIGNEFVYTFDEEVKKLDRRARTSSGWHRARCTPMSSKAARRPRRRSSRTTMSAACRRICSSS